MTPIAAYMLGLITLPAGGLAMWILDVLFHSEALFCPYCSRWIIHVKGDAGRARYMPSIVVRTVGLVHRLTARDRAWRRVHAEYGITPVNPTRSFRPNRLMEARPTDRLDGDSQIYRLVYGFEQDQRSRDEPVVMPYIACLVDGERVSGDVVRHADGSMELRESGSERRMPLANGNAEPNPHIRPMTKE